MKKFYSIIAVASLMLTSVLSFTSCQKDEMPATQAKTQTVQQPAVTVTATSSYTGNSSSIKYMNVTEDGKSFDTTKKIDTSYAVGEWTATVNDTVYTLIVTSSCSKNKYNTEYKATLHVGDKEAYDGIYMTPNFLYSGRFDADALGTDGEPAVRMECPNVNESTLSEITAKFFVMNGRSVVDNVKFVKK